MCWLYTFYIETQVRELEKEVGSLQHDKELIKHQYKYAEKTRIKSGQVCLSIYLFWWILVTIYIIIHFIVFSILIGQFTCK